MNDLIKMFDEVVGDNAYGSATLTTQGIGGSRFTKTGRPPGIWEAEDLPIVAKRLKDIFDRVDGSEFWMNHFKFKYGIPFPTNLKNINKEQALAMNKFGSHMNQATEGAMNEAGVAFELEPATGGDKKLKVFKNKSEADKFVQQATNIKKATQMEENMKNENLRGLMAQGEKIAAFANKQSGHEGGVSSPVRAVLAAATVAGAPDFNGDEDLKAYYTRKLTKAIETQKGKKYMSGFSESMQAAQESKDPRSSLFERMEKHINKK